VRSAVIAGRYSSLAASLVIGRLRSHLNRKASILGGQLKTGNLWTGQNRQFLKRPTRSSSVHLARARAISRRRSAGPIQQGYRVIYREAHLLLDDLAGATLAGTRKDYLAELAAVPLLIIDDLGMRKLPHTAAEDLLEVIMRRYERASTLLTSNRPVDDWGKLLGDTAAITALLCHVWVQCRRRRLGQSGRQRGFLHFERAVRS